jgi:hypothetical protein
MRQLLVLYSTFLLAALGGLAPCSADNSLPLVAVLTPQATGQVSNFGAHIDIDGDRAFIGASQGGFIYRRPTTLGALWMQEQYVNAGAFTFGSSVALRGNVALMGDSGLGTAAQQAGGGRFWMREGADSPYQFAQTVWPADAASHDQFGSSVALGEGFAFIGAENDSHHGKVSTGTATLYEQNSAGQYVEVNKFAPTDLFGGSDFGGSLDLDGDRLVVGASGNGAGEGAAYVYERNAGGANQWGQVAKLEFPGRFYGEDVAVDNDTILVSRPGYDMTAGSVDVYDRDSQTGEWMRTARGVE